MIEPRWSIFVIRPPVPCSSEHWPSTDARLRATQWRHPRGDLRTTFADLLEIRCPRTTSLIELAVWRVRSNTKRGNVHRTGIPGTFRARLCAVGRIRHASTYHNRGKSNCVVADDQWPLAVRVLAARATCRRGSRDPRVYPFAVLGQKTGTPNVAPAQLAPIQPGYRRSQHQLRLPHPRKGSLSSRLLAHLLLLSAWPYTDRSHMAEVPFPTRVHRARRVRGVILASSWRVNFSSAAAGAVGRLRRDPSAHDLRLDADLTPLIAWLRVRSTAESALDIGCRPRGLCLHRSPSGPDE